MEVSLSWANSIFTVWRYVWCAVVVNIFAAGLIYTASLAGAQVNAIRQLREFKAGIAEGVQQMELDESLDARIPLKRKK